MARGNQVVRFRNRIADLKVEVGKAAIVQAKSAVDLAQAQLQRAQKNLSYCTIVSPVKGVIVDRRVNIGQTVVSSLNAPSLFLLAKDLNRLQVWFRSTKRISAGSSRASQSPSP